MQTVTAYLLFLLASAQCSYVAQRQPVCRQVPREVCTDTQVPHTNFVTERQCSAVPTTRQECTTKQEQQCSFQPENKCFDELKTITDIQHIHLAGAAVRHWLRQVGPTFDCICIHLTNLCQAMLDYVREGLPHGV